MGPKLRMAGVLVFLIFALACEPPGQPRDEPPPANEIKDFKTLYASNCAGCHGADGKNGPGRILHDSLYLAVTPKDALRHVIEYGRAGTPMPAWAMAQGGPLEEAQMTALVEGMEREWKGSFDPHGAPLPAYDGAGLSGDLANGKKLFVRDCFACHAKGGPVGPVTEPSYLALSTNQNLRTSIIVGRPDARPLPMPNYLTLNLGHALSDQDIADIVAYLASLRPANSATGEAK